MNNNRSQPVTGSRAKKVADVRLVEAMVQTAERFRGAGVFLAVVDDRGAVIAHDEGAETEFRRAALALVRGGQVFGVPEGKTGRDESRDDGAGLGWTWFSVGGGSARRVVVVARSAAAGELLAGLIPAIRGTMEDRLAESSSEEQLDGMTSQLADTYEELSLLYQVSSGMRVNRDPEDFFRGLCNDVRGVLSTRSLGVSLRTGRGMQSRLVVTGDLDLDPPQLSRFTDELFEELVDRSTSGGSAGAGGAGVAVVVNDLSAVPSMSWLSPNVRQLLAVPLSRGGQVLGFVFAVDREAGVFDSVDVKLLSSVASVSAIFVENVLLYDDVHGLLMGLLHSLTSAVDAKDSYTCGHSERVALIARELAVAAGFDESEAERVYMAGLLHDVGKIGVPEAVLQKCGRLTEEEFSQMKQHPEVGAKILADVRQVQDIIPGVLYHHERYDGKGYPQRLAGTDIPILGRLICLADSLDAMTSNRTYRRGMPIQQALEEINRCAGKQFDPELARTLLEIGSDRLMNLLERHRNQKNRDFGQTVRHARAA